MDKSELLMHVLKIEDETGRDGPLVIEKKGLHG
jgi:hypothetical protein